MPIQFRCTGCNQKLAISRRKAGKPVKCPACATELQVPTLDEADAKGQLVEPADEPLERTPAPSAAPAAEDAPPADDAPPAADEVAPPTSSGSAPPPEEGVVGQRESVLPGGESSVGDPATLVAGAGSASLPWDEDEEDEDDGFYLTRRPTDDRGLDMTPMVDVTFLLLIFFMITATFSLQKSMETEAPEPDQEGFAQMPTIEDLANDSVIVEIDENDNLFVDDVQVGSIPEVVDLLAQKIAGEQKLEMIIEPHPLAKHGTVVQVTDAGIEVGMQRIRRVTRKGD